MAQRVNDTVLKQLKEKYAEKFEDSRTEHIALTSHAMRNSKEVANYQKNLTEYP